MTSSRYAHITDELLSSYIDEAVTEDEKAFIEAALLDDPAIAWRLETLRYTVNLLHALPNVALPRTFTLSEIQLAGVTQPVAPQTSVSRARQQRRPALGFNGLGEWWQNFWQIGNLFLRNAAAASLAIFLVVSLSNLVFAGRTSPVPRAIQPELSSVAEAPRPTTLATTTSAVASVQNQNQIAQQTRVVQTEVGMAASENRNPTSPTLDQSSTTAPPVESGKAQYSVHAPGPSGGAAGVNELAPEQPNVANGNATVSGAAVSAAAKIQTTNAFSNDTATGAVHGPATMVDAQSITQTAQTATMTVLATATFSPTTVVAITTTTMTVGSASQPPTEIAPTANPTLSSVVGAQRTLAQSVRGTWLRIAQLVSALLTLIFALLWWRSRTINSPMVES